jgi:two-component system, LytTR family, response regulator
MKKVNVLVVDDEANVRSVIVRLLTDLFSDSVQVIGEAESTGDAFALINERHPQLVLLDIEMHGEDGFQLLELFEKIPFDVIFITSYNQYAIKAIRCGALDYLLKPVMLNEFKAAIEKALNRNRELVSIEKNIQAIQQNRQSKPGEQTIVLNQKNKIDTVYAKDIVWLEGDINYTIVHLLNGKKHYVAKTLKDFEEMLCDGGSGFMRIHKVSIVNTIYIEKIIQGKTTILQMRTGEKLEISRRKKTEVLSGIGQLGN